MSVTGVSILGYIITACVDEAARTAVAQIRAGESPSDFDSVAAPLDMRLVRVAWVDPEIRPASEPLPEAAVLLVARGSGRTLLIEASPPPGRPAWRMDVPDSAVMLRER